MSDDQIGEDPQFEEEGLDDFADFEGGGNSLADAWRNNPLVKVGVVVGGLATLVGGIILFGGEPQQVASSKAAKGSSVSDVPAADDVSDVYRQAVEEVDAEAVEEAMRTRGSAMPTPIAPPPGRVTLPEDDVTEEDPLERWRRIQEERVRRTGEAEPIEEEDPNLEVINQLAEAMSGQMQSILDTKEVVPPRSFIVVEEEPYDPPWVVEAEAEEAALEAAAKQSAEQVDSEEVVNIILPAGTIAYAQLLTEADSDVPGPVLAEIAGGPLSGSRLLGSFDTAEGGEHLVLNFETIVVDGEALSIQAVALNPDTAKVGMVTDLNKRYLKRVLLPAAASFVRGFSSAVATAGGTSVSVSGDTVIEQEEELDTREEVMKGVEEAADTFGTLMEEEADKTKVQIRVRAGTPMGVLFLQPVTESQ